MKISTKDIAAGLIAFTCLAGGHVQAQTIDLKAASYGSDTVAAGTAPNTGVTSTLGTFTVNQIYVNSTATYTYNFITDASGVSNYIYFPTPAGTTDPFVANATYSGVQVTSAPFGTPNNLELTIPAGTTVPAPTATGLVGIFTAVTEGSLTTTSVLTDNYTIRTATVPNDIEPVQFTFTPNAAQTVTPVTGNYTGTDASNGDVINFYRPTAGLTFATGNTYTIDGYAFAFSTGTEIYDPSIVSSTAAVPEPSSYALTGFAGIGLLLIARGMRRANVS